MTQTPRFQSGDRVRHQKRPEWGIGRIDRVENTAIGGTPAQRLIIRFPNAGLKTLSTLGAALALVSESEAANNGSDLHGPQTLVEMEQHSESGWLGEISKQRPEDAMINLPPEATDPFAGGEARLRATLDLYRFEPTGGSLIDWAVARSGLDDPLSRFTRQELEQFFERWVFLRDRQLEKLVAQAQPGLVEKMLADAPPAARRAVAARHGRR